MSHGSVAEMTTGELVKARVLSGFAWAFITAFIIATLVGQEIVAGMFIIAGAVAAMNGLARTDIIIANREWWYHHPIMRRLHFINTEGELAGIVTAGIVYLTYYYIHPETISHLHIPWHEAATLIGIMSFANVTVTYMKTVMGVIENIGNRFGIGRWAVVFFGSMLSSLTGEPGAAIFLSDYVYNRIPANRRSNAATAIAASIGSGGGLLPFAAPPILIVWPYLESELGWTIWTLVTFVGLGAVAHAATCAVITSFIMSSEREDNGSVAKAVIPVLLLLALVIAHIVEWPLIYWVDLIIGVSASVLMMGSYTSKLQAIKRETGLRGAELESDPEYIEQKERRFSAMFQPMILGALLIGLEIIGVGAEPFIGYLASLIPTTLPLWALGLILFFVTGVVSHISDNALASRVFIVVALGFIPQGIEVASLLAMSVISGALFGGFLTIPGNLPNFAINRRFKVGSAEWVWAALPLYLTAVVYVVALLFQFWIHL